MGMHLILASQDLHQIISIVLSYFDLIRTEGVTEARFAEQQTIAKTTFLFREHVWEFCVT